MIVNRCVEQGIYVTLILSLQEGHKPLKSTQLSSILAVSDSYLKKILRKLVLANIIVSYPGKDGGFQLEHSVEDISVYDIYAALEGKECELKLSGIGNRIFIDGEKFSEGEAKVKNVFADANAAFLDQLKKLYLSELLSKANYLDGHIDFGKMTDSV